MSFGDLRQTSDTGLCDQDAMSYATIAAHGDAKVRLLSVAGDDIKP